MIAVWCAIPKASKMKHIQNGFLLIPFASRSLKFCLLINNLMTLKFELPQCLCVRWERWTRLWDSELAFTEEVGVSTAKANLSKTLSSLWAWRCCSSLTFLFSFKYISGFKYHHFVYPRTVCLLPSAPSDLSGLIKKVVICCFQSEVVFYALDR